jgi:hypothetical protein
MRAAAPAGPCLEVYDLRMRAAANAVVLLVGVPLGIAYVAEGLFGRTPNEAIAGALLVALLLGQPVALRLRDRALQTQAPRLASHGTSHPV